MRIAVGILLLKASSDDIYLRLSLSSRNVWFETREHCHVMRTALRGHRFFTARIDCNRRPQFDGLVLNGKLKPIRHNADDGVVLAVKHDCFADDVQIGTEAILPESTAQDNDASAVAGLVLFGAECSTKDRRRTQ